jgi:dihydrodipicolinate synthase/N-acetylneuraminate lyase
MMIYFIPFVAQLDKARRLLQRIVRVRIIQGYKEITTALAEISELVNKSVGKSF